MTWIKNLTALMVVRKTGTNHAKNYHYCNCFIFTEWMHVVQQS
jgi:hypothetical protein